MSKIVTMGGGTGQYQILRGLKKRECDITAIVSVFDDGGSSGRLRDEYGILPPGDARQCLLALADDDIAEDLRRLFNYRFEFSEKKDDKTKADTLKGFPNCKSERGHSVGNLNITAMIHIHGDMAGALTAIGRLYHLKGKVLPVSLDKATLYAEAENVETKEAKTLQGESKISSLEKGLKIKRVFLKPEAYMYQQVGNEIREAYKVVICPGSLYGSTLPNLLVNGIPEFLDKSRAKKIYVCNLFTKEDTRGYQASDFVREVEKHLGSKLDDILINTNAPQEEYLKNYLSEGEELVVDDLGADKRVTRDDYIIAYPSEKRTLIRHDPQKIARAIISLR